MSLLDDNLINNLDLYIVKNELINFLNKYNWYNDIVNCKTGTLSEPFFYKDVNNCFQLIYQSRYKIQIKNNRVELVAPVVVPGSNNYLYLIFENQTETIESISKHILDCLKMFKIKIYYGTKILR